MTTELERALSGPDDAVEVLDGGGPLTADEARRLTDRAKSLSADLAEALRTLHHGNAAKALGYGEGIDSWKSYVAAEFGISAAHAYRLIDFADVRDALPPNGDTERLTESVARSLAILLPEGTADTRTDDTVMEPVRETLRDAWQAVVRQRDEADEAAETKPERPSPITAAFARKALLSSGFLDPNTVAAGEPNMSVLVGRIGDTLDAAALKLSRVEAKGSPVSARPAEQARRYAEQARAIADRLEALAG